MKNLIIVSVLLFIFLKINTTFAWDTTAAKFYPLSVGNYYVFAYYHLSFDCSYYQFVGFRIADITSTTILSNGKKYFIFEGWMPGYSWIYQRIDSVTMNVYSYNTNTLEEDLLDSLHANVGDTFLGKRNPFSAGPCIVADTSTQYLFNATRLVKPIIAYGTVSMRYSLIEGIGFSGISACTMGSGEAYILKGCVINGVLYGDTTPTPSTARQQSNSI
ncbi:hypothetical protein ACFLSV_02720 [Bacteroidota bacterium]